jgi:hypothetical protein
LIPQLFQQRKDIFFVGGGSWNRFRGVSFEMLLSRIVCLRKGFCLAGGVDDSVHVPKQSLILESDQSLCVRQTFTFAAFASTLLEVALEKQDVASALDSIFFLKITNENQMMERVWNLAKKIKPTLFHSRIVAELLYAILTMRNSKGN